MWLWNIITMWNMYNDSTGVKFVHETETKHDVDKISVKDDNFILFYEP